MDVRLRSVLEKLESVPGNREKFWNVSPDAGNFLNILVKSLKAQTVLEIGTSNGYSGLWFAEALSHTGGKLYTVESHRERFRLAGEHFAEAGVQNVVDQIFGHAPEIFSTPEYQNRRLAFDLVFLDATKMEYASYLETVLPQLRAGGVLVADNMLSHEPDLKDFLDLVHQKRELQSVVLPLGSGLLLAYKNL